MKRVYTFPLAPRSFRNPSCAVQLMKCWTIRAPVSL